jgi:hypothetical protein
MTVLFHPPPTELIAPVSQQSALRFGPSNPIGLPHLASLGACGPSPVTLRPVGRVPCPPWWVVTPTTTMVAPSPWASRPVGDPVIRSMIDVLAHCRCPVRALMRPHWSWPVLRRGPGQPSNSRYKTVTEDRRSTVKAARALLSRGVRAIQLSPWCAGLAEPPILQRLRTISAFSTGSASPFPFGSGLVQWPRNIPPRFSTLRVGSIMSCNGAIGCSHGPGVPERHEKEAATDSPTPGRGAPAVRRTAWPRRPAPRWGVLRALPDQHAAEAAACRMPHDPPGVC